VPVIVASLFRRFERGAAAGFPTAYDRVYFRREASRRRSVSLLSKPVVVAIDRDQSERRRCAVFASTRLDDLITSVASALALNEVSEMTANLRVGRPSCFGEVDGG
jgi:hypothetical protein